ncbi:Uncharacterized protein DAT39_017506 [Clarias magur]|uniref:Uncharacterized protein n=1 Tax=Clarias magur TaxID=1594786 RepID=A0A8J4U8M0_CLAMG|nr:Uncharacterized protein DAT39_017506 [Clarias magur]
MNESHPDLPMTQHSILPLTVLAPDCQGHRSTLSPGIRRHSFTDPFLSLGLFVFAKRHVSGGIAAETRWHRAILETMP